MYLGRAGIVTFEADLRFDGACASVKCEFGKPGELLAVATQTVLRPEPLTLPCHGNSGQVSQDISLQSDNWPTQMHECVAFGTLSGQFAILARRPGSWRPSLHQHLDGNDLIH
jgi:hypothetical protein